MVLNVFTLIFSLWPSQSGVSYPQAIVPAEPWPPPGGCSSILPNSNKIKPTRGKKQTLKTTTGTLLYNKDTHLRAALLFSLQGKNTPKWPTSKADKCLHTWDRKEPPDLWHDVYTHTNVKGNGKKKLKQITDCLEESPRASVWNGTFMSFSMAVQHEIITRHFAGYGQGQVIRGLWTCGGWRLLLASKGTKRETGRHLVSV